MQEKALALRQIAVLRRELKERYTEARQLGSLMSTPVPVSEALRSWKIRAAGEINNSISQAEARNLEALDVNSIGYVNPFNIPEKQFRLYDEFLAGLADAIENDPTSVLQVVLPRSINEEKRVTTSSPKKNVIFIVHGHDEVNLHRLEKLLKERFKLDCKILSIDPNAGRTLIEKLEQEGRKASFAFVLLTPDDQVSKQELQYKQARPNVIFELGWFYGKLGRKKVCVLAREDTTIPTDLAGIVRIDFKEFVNEKVEAIESELVGFGLIKKG